MPQAPKDTIQSKLALYCKYPDLINKSEILSSKLSIPIISDINQTGFEFILQVTDEGLALSSVLYPKYKPLMIDFHSGKLQHRLASGVGKQQPLGKALGLSNKKQLHVVDATAGLGQDAFLMAILGCRVTLIEENPIVYTLLVDALERGLQTPSIENYVENMSALQGDACTLLPTLEQPDVVYLDPMFPTRQKSALVKKEMQILQALLDKTAETGQLIENALNCAKKRVVVKRPKGAPPLKENPSFEIKGKTIRYDTYLC